MVRWSCPRTLPGKGRGPARKMSRTRGTLWSPSSGPFPPAGICRQNWQEYSICRPNSERPRRCKNETGRGIHLRGRRGRSPNISKASEDSHFGRGVTVWSSLPRAKIWSTRSCLRFQSARKFLPVPSKVLAESPPTRGLRVPRYTGPETPCHFQLDTVALHRLGNHFFCLR